MTTKFGWCVTSQHQACWRTVGGDHPHYPEITCTCTCHESETTND